MEAKKKSFKLELGLALFVIVVVLGVAYNAISMLRNDLNLANTTQQLSTYLRLAQEEAKFDGAQYGFAIDDSGYVFYRRDDAGDAWDRITNDTLFPAARLPAHKDLQVVVEGELARLQQDEPQIILQPNRQQQFSLQFIDEQDHEYVITSTQDGEINWIASSGE